MIELSGDVVVEWEPEELLQATDAGLERSFRRFGETVRRDVIASLIPRGRPSLPGETPSDNSGALRDIRTAWSDRDNQIAIGVADWHLPGDTPAELEWGSPDMQPRPYLRPAMVRSFPQLMAELTDSIY